MKPDPNLRLGSDPETPRLQGLSGNERQPCEADDGARTRDLRLGKPTLYQLSYVRNACQF